jgi:tellurite methyltransferase
VRAVDADAAAIRSVRRLVDALNLALPPDQIHYGSLDSLPYDDDSTDAVICIAVLHFARNERASAVNVISRLLRDGCGYRMVLSASSSTSGHSWRGPPRSGGTLADPLKTTNVQNMRCMTTWVVEK